MRHLPIIALIAAIAACAPSRREPAPVVYQGTAPSGQVQSQAAPRPAAPAPETGVADGRGVVLYDGYEAIRARRGDTVDAMARRVGLSGPELAAYNGLSTIFTPDEGDELVLPPRADRYSRTAVAAAPQPGVQTRTAAASSIPETYLPSVGPAGDPAAGATAGTATDAAQTDPNAPGWSAALARAAIEAPAPPPDPSPELSSTATADPVQTEAAVQPAPQPLPTEAPAAQPAPVAAPSPSQPELSQTASQSAPEPETAVQIGAQSTSFETAGASGRFQRPTAATVSRPFSQTPGPERNDGVDFATSAGDPVVAADDGTVALISNSLGGLGTIILIRHDNQFLTVYGRLGAVTVRKGDSVTRGQVIATVADLQAPKLPHLHFEVRKGAESVDPMTYF